MDSVTLIRLGAGLLLVLALAYYLLRRPGGRTGREMYCPHCGQVDVPLRRLPGSFAIELALFLFFVVPGIIYCLWRLTNRYDACGYCGQDGVLPLEAPRAQADLRRFSAVR